MFRLTYFGLTSPFPEIINYVKQVLIVLTWFSLSALRVVFPALYICSSQYVPIYVNFKRHPPAELYVTFEENSLRQWYICYETLSFPDVIHLHNFIPCSPSSASQQKTFPIRSTSLTVTWPTTLGDTLPSRDSDYSSWKNSDIFDP